MSVRLISTIIKGVAFIYSVINIIYLFLILFFLIYTQYIPKQLEELGNERCIRGKAPIGFLIEQPNLRYRV